MPDTESGPQDKQFLVGDDALTNEQIDAVNLQMPEKTAIQSTQKESNERATLLQRAQRLYNRVTTFGFGRSPWLFQSLSCLLSVTLLYCLITIALTYGNRPLNQWRTTMFSMSALVSVLSTVMKGALMVPLADTISQQKWSWFRQPLEGKPFKDVERIDRVSRGTWGSFQWLLNSPMASKIISLGAFLTILTLAFDVFSQQFISIDIRTVPDQLGTAYFPWVYNKTEYDRLAWLGAMYSGFFSHEVRDLAATCSSSNCTWSAISSVGICGACHDVTHTMPTNWKQCDDHQCQYTGTFVYNESDHIDGSGGRNIWIATNLTLNHEFNVTEPYKCQELTQLNNAASFAVGRGDDRLWKLLGVYPYMNGSIADGDTMEPKSNSFLKSVEVIEVPRLGSDDEGNCLLSHGTAATVTQCGLWYCRHDFDAQVTLGIQNQTMREGPPAYSPDGSNVEWLIPGPANTTHLHVARIGSELDLSHYLTGNGSTWSVSTNMGAQVWQSNREDRDAWISRVAKSLSNELRSQNKVSMSNGTGQTLLEEAYIKVSWPWIAFPTATVVAVVILFVVNVVHTSRSGVPVWTSGSIALALAGMDGGIRDLAKGTYDSYHQMIATVGDLHWLQEAPDQKTFVPQYCRYSGEIRKDLNIKQTVGRALQFANSSPKGPVYVAGAREAMAELIQPYALDQNQWGPIGPGALPEEAIRDISHALVCADSPLIITGYSGRDRQTPKLLVALADLFPGIRVQDAGGSHMCFLSPTLLQRASVLRQVIPSNAQTQSFYLIAMFRGYHLAIHLRSTPKSTIEIAMGRSNQ
ncbi:hypothetical protein PFICI_11713 [Pestalotiopsis fici W106-1]|uniref:Uncharacterized protein n=1 Tax=Pestalotiopsis fici (strain W106-1 / CGMCC3.15140) TaxID=1229662 RepID=W3WU11_PESFW|nr:uncharacterized protein PFICI_11713 [Pestalotiopsis fici W106-1]ETS76326.1 hypothetical protein PFICI_11713 [Pestalotiopsis fici W106-1]